MLLGDARSGKLADNIAGFGRALRRAGVKVDSQRIALAKDAALAVGISEREDLSAAFEAVMVSREQDRLVFRELFDVYFQDPKVANKLLAQLLPSAEARPSRASAVRVCARRWRRKRLLASRPSPVPKTRRSSSTPP